ncbi:unnamed protein product [Blepharisma stoltei]|uniref:Tc1-like transposase DDE domain-containing protein n=1 Tax=Blepharisma stoltei TaxID=1481888 RepID=A0AAU9JF37_9CILI|nr:unnamed protein product [Blepharisma stoltei]
MVKKRKSKKSFKEVQVASNYIETTDLIDPWIERTRDQILHVSKWRQIRISTSEEDKTSYPEGYPYEYILDFIAGESDTVENPLPVSEAEEFAIKADELLTEFSSKAPEYDLNDSLLNYKLDKEVTIGQMLDAIKISPYQYEFQTYLEQNQWNTINTIKIKPKEEDLIIETIDHLKRGLSLKETTNEMKGRVSYEKVKDIFKNYKIYGEKYVRKVKRKLTPALKPEHLQFLKEISEDPRNTVLSGRERKLLLCNHFGIRIGTDHVRQALKEMGYSIKRIRTFVPEADRVSHKNARCRVAQQLILLQQSGKELVSIDECQVNRGETAHYGWAKKGQKALNINGFKGKPLQIITAVRSCGLLGYIIRPKKIDQFGYKHFLGLIFGKLKEIDPVNYKDRFFLFMDNASAHKTKLVKDYIETQGITVLCNAPMTPQLNPIEYIFSMFKWNLRRMPMSNDEALIEYIYDAFKRIRPRHIYNAYIHSIRSYKASLRYEQLHDARGYNKIDAKIKFSGKHIKALINFDKLNTKKQED